VNQPELQFTLDLDDQAALRAWLARHGWQTRHELTSGLNWSERKVRLIAESLGADVVRGQAGYHLTDTLTRDDLPAATQARDAALSQGKRMIRYALALGRRLHALIK
jgi:hypothetical protein